MLTSHMAAIEEHLLAISGIPANTGHPLHKGTPREAFIRTFLEGHLNSTVQIGSGEIIDSSSKPGGLRNQFDIVVFKRNYPKLDFGGGISGLLVESVVATIEIKSTLDKAGVLQAVRAAAAAKRLEKNEFRSFQAGYVPPSVLSFVVAYDGPANVDTAHRWLKEAYAEEGISEPVLPEGAERVMVAGPALEGIFILGKGYMTFDNAPHGVIHDQQRKAFPAGRWALVQAERGSILALFLHLTAATGNLDGAWLNPLPYLGAFKASSVSFKQ